MRRLRSTKDDDGFTIVEVMVAAVVLLVGILGVTTVVNTANSTTTSNKAREQGLALAREIIESARSVRYQALRPANAVATVQAMPGLGDSGTVAGWDIKRRGITFSVSLGVCSVDDPGDGTGAHVASSYCARSAVAATPATCATLVGTPAKINGTGSASLDSADCGLDTNLDGAVDGLLQATASGCPAGTTVEAGTCDAQPDDFKRLVVLITWDRGAGRRYVLQQSTESFPGLSAYAAITKLEVHGAGPAPSGGYVIKPSGGVAPTEVQFDAESSEPANQVNWLLDGAPQGQATWSGTSGTFTWPLGTVSPDTATGQAAGEVLDGSYMIGARVQDAAGIHGAELNTTVTINRRKPFPPGTPQAVYESGTTTLTFQSAPDQDIVGYRVHRWVNGANETTWSCTASPCTDNPPSSGTVTYKVAALDTDPDTGAQREGVLSGVATVNSSPTSTKPPTPGNFKLASATSAPGNKYKLSLTWDTVPGATYLVFVDSLSNSPYTRSAPPFEDTVRSGETHDYWVKALVSGLRSDPAGPVHYVAP